MDSYVEATGDTEHKPLSSGGATYARAMDNCVAYGIILPGVEKVNTCQMKIWLLMIIKRR